MSPRLFYRSLAVAEAVTWTGLITVMVLKYGFGVEGAFTTIVGGVHGLVFLAYAFTAVLVGVNQRWSIPLIALAVACAIVPYATIPVEVWADRTGRLDGGWRRTAGDHPGDANWVNHTLRWFLGHTVVLVLVFVVGIGGIMTVLLMAGPPSEW